MTIKIAVIGVGLIGPRHCHVVLEEPTATLVCVVDPSPSATALAAGLDVPAFEDVDSMLKSENRPDAAIVCTPNHTHVAISEQLLKSGVHVLVEKPLCVDITSGQRLVTLAAQTRARLLVGHHRRFHPQVRATKALLERNELGTIIGCSGLWAMNKPDTYFDATWRQSSASGGPILINLIHDVDILQYLFGPIRRVYAEETPRRRKHEAEEGAAVTLRFDSGLVGTFLLCDAGSSPWSFEQGTGENPVIPYTAEGFLRVVGSEGSLSVGDMVKWSYGSNCEHSWTNTMKKEGVTLEDGVPFESQVRHFVKVAKGEVSPICSVEDGLSAVRVCDAVKRSINTGQPVLIEKIK